MANKNWEKFKQGASKVWGTTKKVTAGSYETAKKVSKEMGPGIGEVNKITEDVWSLRAPQQQPSFSNPNTTHERMERLNRIKEHDDSMKVHSGKVPDMVSIGNAPWDPEFFNPLNNSTKRIVGVPRNIGFNPGFFGPRSKPRNFLKKKRR